MPSYAIKSGRVLQLREDFADEREDHALSVYQRDFASGGRRFAQIKTREFSGKALGMVAG
jgi:hypothetical protein